MAQGTGYDCNRLTQPPLTGITDASIPENVRYNLYMYRMRTLFHQYSDVSIPAGPRPLRATTRTTRSRFAVLSGLIYCVNHRKMIPSEIFAEDLMSTVIRYGLYIGAAFQLVCLMACVTLTDEQSEPHPYEKAYTDSDECSSEQSSPGHRAAMSRARRHDKKKRR